MTDESVLVADQEAAIAVGMERLKPLMGTWKGDGHGDFPTIDAFRYSEELTFESNGVEALLRYEQRTWLVATGNGAGDEEPLHWEVGFVIPTGVDRVDLSNTQNGGRVEVLTGEIKPLEHGVRITMDSVLLGRDERLVSTRRAFSVIGDQLTYAVDMATDRSPVLQRHLRAELSRTS